MRIYKRKGQLVIETTQAWLIAWLSGRYASHIHLDGEDGEAGDWISLVWPIRRWTKKGRRETP